MCENDLRVPQESAKTPLDVAPVQSREGEALARQSYQDLVNSSARRAVSANRRIDDTIEILEDREPSSSVPAVSRPNAETNWPVQDPWSRTLARHRKPVFQPSRRAPKEDHAEPLGTISIPAVNIAPFSVAVTKKWARHPRQMGSFTLTELSSTERLEVGMFQRFMSTSTELAHQIRELWSQAIGNCFQIPHDVLSDSVFIRCPEDAVYLEQMGLFLAGQQERSLIADPVFWRYYLPRTDTPEDRTCVARIRAEWSLSVGHRKIIAIEDYLAVREDVSIEGTKHIYDVCTDPTRNKYTRFTVNLPCLELPGILLSWRGEMGLSIRMHRVLYYLGSCFTSQTRIKNADSQLSIALEYEFLHALVCALYYDARMGVAWLLSETCVQFLELNSDVADIPVTGSVSICVKKLAQDQRNVFSLPVEFFLERLDYPSRSRVWWVFHDSRGNYIRAVDYKGPLFGGHPVVQTREPKGGLSRGRCFGGFSDKAPKIAVAGRSEKVEQQPSSSKGHGDLDTAVSDEVLRSDRYGREILGLTAERRGGWSVREVLAEAVKTLHEDDDKTNAIRDGSAKLERENETLRETSETLRKALSELRANNKLAPEPKRARVEIGMGMVNPYLYGMGTMAPMPLGFPNAQLPWQNLAAQAGLVAQGQVGSQSRLVNQGLLGAPSQLAYQPQITMGSQVEERVNRRLEYRERARDDDDRGYERERGRDRGRACTRERDYDREEYDQDRGPDYDPEYSRRDRGTRDRGQGTLSDPYAGPSFDPYYRRDD